MGIEYGQTNSAAVWPGFWSDEMKVVSLLIPAVRMFCDRHMISIYIQFILIRQAVEPDSVSVVLNGSVRAEACSLDTESCSNWLGG